MTAPSTGRIHGEYLRLKAALSALKQSIFHYDQEVNEWAQDIQEQLKLVRSVAVDEVKGATVPREITADDLKPGQVVICWTMRPDDSQFISASGRVFRFEHHKGRRSDVWLNTEAGEVGWDLEADDGYTIVLLADAPVEQQEPERLTVADLENAPVGSVLSSASGSRFAQKFTKYATGVWDGDLTGQQYTSRELESCGYSVLTTPPAPVTAETIRASEPGSTWTHPETDRIYEWTGEVLLWQRPGGKLGRWEQIDKVDSDGDWYRSTAAPRGDYGKKELPTEPGSVIEVTEFGGLYDADPPIAAYRNRDHTWRRVDQDVWPGDYVGLYAPDHEITGWLPAKVVTDD